MRSLTAVLVLITAHAVFVRGGGGGRDCDAGLKSCDQTVPWPGRHDYSDDMTCRMLQKYVACIERVCGGHISEDRYNRQYWRILPAGGCGAVTRNEESTPIPDASTAGVAQTVLTAERRETTEQSPPSLWTESKLATLPDTNTVSDTPERAAGSTTSRTAAAPTTHAVTPAGVGSPKSAEQTTPAVRTTGKAEETAGTVKTTAKQSSSLSIDSKLTASASVITTPGRTVSATTSSTVQGVTSTAATTRAMKTATIGSSVSAAPTTATTRAMKTTTVGSPRSVSSTAGRTTAKQSQSPLSESKSTSSIGIKMASGKTVSATRRATVSIAQVVTAPTVGSSKSAEQTATTTPEVTTTTSGSPKSAEQVADTTRVVKTITTGSSKSAEQTATTPEVTTTTSGSSKPAEQTAGTTRAMKTTTVRSTKSASQKRQTAASSTTNPMKTAPTSTHINDGPESDTVTPATGLRTETLPPRERGTVARSLDTTNRPAARGGPYRVFRSTTQRHTSPTAVSREYDASVTGRGMHVISDTSLPPAAAYRSTDIVDSDGATTAPAKETAEMTGAAAAAVSNGGQGKLTCPWMTCLLAVLVSVSLYAAVTNNT